MIRGLKKTDLPRIMEIHQKFYKDEFDLPDFSTHFINVTVITDDNDDIICVTGLRPILEVVSLTNKEKKVRERIGALNDMLTINAYIASHDKFDELHAFVQDPNWESLLKKKSFTETRGKALVFKI